MGGGDGEADLWPQIDVAELRRALSDFQVRESLVWSRAPLARLLRQAGAYAEAIIEEIDYTDWNGAIVGRGPGSTVLRDGIPPSAELSYAELAPLLEMGSFARVLVARHPSTPRHVLAALAGEELDVQMALATRGDLGAEVEMRLAGSAFSDVRFALAKDPRTSAAALELLAAHSSLRRVLAERSDVSDAMLAAFVDDPDPLVRARVAAHSKVKVEWLDKLADDPVEHVRRAAAGSWLTPADALGRIAEQPMAEETRAALANNPRTPAAALAKAFAGAPWKIRATIASRQALSESLQRAAAEDEDAPVRAAVARSGTDAAILARLAGDPKVDVRRALAGNPAFQALEDLATDPNLDVRIALARRAGLPDQVLEALIADAVVVRVALAESMSASTPPEIRARLAADRDERVRLAASSAGGSR